ncbi:hypothetical protein OIU84_009534 [Salix udensis]|uniref:Uncharacterized protein n=1 Tax=Salix udensis TaxID=889485 RepID=A0AAD6NYW5_9ROSI|nr:hypothetical protein OIU84_009534 [Salix udensis]
MHKKYLFKCRFLTKLQNTFYHKPLIYSPEKTATKL